MPKKQYIQLERMNPPDVRETEWNEWYNRKHIPERLRFPEFLAARRFVAIEGDGKDTKYMTIYELSSLDVLASEAYLKLIDEEAHLPPDSFEAITPRLPGFTLGVYEQVHPDDEYRMPDTEFLLANGIDVPPEKEEEFNAWYNTDHMPAVSKVPGFAAARRSRIVDIQLPTKAGSSSLGAKYTAFYDISSPDVLKSEAHEVARKSPWTTWIHSWYTRRYRFVGRRIFVKGRG